MKPVAGAVAALLVLSAPAVAVFAAPGSSQAAAPAPGGGSEPTLTPEEQAKLRKLQELDRSLTRRTGAIQLPAANVTLNLGEGYYFLGAEDSRKVLVDGWGNPPDSVEGVLGMVVPAGKSPFEDTWAAVVRFAPDGYVSDHDAKDIDPTRLLSDLREGETEENRARTQAGYPEVHMAGWAQPPSYDAARHTLIWAKDIAFVGEPLHTLNYDVRILGRKGVLSINMVAAMSDLAAVRTAAERLQTVVAFDQGQRYADYKQGDHKAEFGVAGLVAAGLGLAAAKKIGLLGGLLLFGKKFIALIVAGVAGIGAWLRKLFGGRRD